MRLLVPIASMLLLSCQATSPNAGSGPLVLSVTAQAFFEQYKKADNPEHFAISLDGTKTGAITCPAHQCVPDLGGERAIAVCEKFGKPCKLFAVGREIVWTGRITYAENLRPSRKPLNVAWGWSGAGRLTVWHSGHADFSKDELRPQITLFIDRKKCEGEIDVSAKTWSIYCDAIRKSAKGTISTGGDIWEGMGWDNKDSQVQIRINFVQAIADNQSSAKIYQQNVSPSSVGSGALKNFLSSSDISLARTYAKPLVGPIELRLQALRGPISFQKLEEFTIKGVAQPASKSNFRLRIKPKTADTFDVLLAARSDAMSIEIQAQAPFNNRGMKLEQSTFEFSHGPQFAGPEGEAIKKLLDGFMGMLFPSAGRQLSREGDKLYVTIYDGILPGLSGKVHSTLVGETIWEGRSVLIGEIAGSISSAGGIISDLSGEISGIDIVDAKSSLLLATSQRIIARSNTLGTFEGANTTRIEKDSIGNLP